MVAAGNLKYLDNLVGLIETMLGDIDKEALELAKKKRNADEFMDALEDHDANARRVYGLPSESEIEEIIDSVEIVNPEDKKNGKNKPNLK